jgi:hypothetical protein
MGSKRAAVTALFVLLSVSGLDAGEQGDFRSGAVKTEQGYLLVWNEPSNHYTLEIRGKDVRQISDERIHFSVDSMFLQILTLETGQFLQGGKRRNLDDRSILTAHQEWEGKYLEETHQKKLAFETSWKTLESGKEALLWRFKIPEGTDTNVIEQIYLTTVKGDHVLMLGSALTARTDENAAWKVLVDTVSTLKVSDKPIDVSAVQKSVRKESS